MHRDIKLENILIDNIGTIKIADFGLSKIVTTVPNTEQKKNKKGEKVGTRAYWAPEVWNGGQSMKSDIWAAGVVLYIMIYGMLPFGADDGDIESAVNSCEQLKYN